MTGGIAVKKKKKNQINQVMCLVFINNSVYLYSFKSDTILSQLLKLKTTANSHNSYKVRLSFITYEVVFSCKLIQPVQKLNSDCV